MLEIYYHTLDRDGYKVPGHYKGIDNDMLFWEHVAAAKKEAKTSGSNFYIERSIYRPFVKKNWVDPSWPVILFPKKTRKTFMGRYVD
jgi:hypothetical protein